MILSIKTFVFVLRQSGKSLVSAPYLDGIVRMTAAPPPPPPPFLPIPPPPPRCDSGNVVMSLQPRSSNVAMIDSRHYQHPSIIHHLACPIFLLGQIHVMVTTVFNIHTYLRHYSHILLRYSILTHVKDTIHIYDTESENKEQLLIRSAPSSCLQTTSTDLAGENITMASLVLEPRSSPLCPPPLQLPPSPTHHRTMHTILRPLRECHRDDRTSTSRPGGIRRDTPRGT